MNPLAQASTVDRGALLSDLEAVYQDLHRHPELSMHEVRTSKIAADSLQALGYAVTRQVGGTGVVGTLRNGEGPTVMLRADMDALPMAEETGLPYASTSKTTDDEGAEIAVAHACGHDLHVTWMMGVARVLAEHREAWRGTVLVAFQPGEEIGRGADSMVKDWGRHSLPKPDVILGQHVMVGAAGTVGYRSGVILTTADGLEIHLYGRGSHGSQPQMSIDPVIMAAATTLRLQTIVSREISPQDDAVVTIGSLQAGTKENIIPDDATLKLNVRTYRDDVRERVLSAIHRICRAECEASNAQREPEFVTLSHYPLTENDDAATGRVAAAFNAQFGDNAHRTAPGLASEDFSIFGRTWQVPYVFWFVGGTDPAVFARAQAEHRLNELPSNHSPRFAPILHPTLETGLEAMLTAASAWLCGEAGGRAS